VPHLESDLLLGAIAAFFIGLGKGGLASMGTFSVPIMALSMSPIRAAAILLPVLVFSDMVALWLYRGSFSARNLKILIPAAATGTFIGWLTAKSVSDASVGLLIGVIGVAYCVNIWRTRRRPIPAHTADVPRGAFWGIIMGFASFVSHAGAPPFQVYVLPQRLPKLTYAGTAAIAFAAINAMKLLPYYALGQFSAPNLRLSADLALPAFVGALAGRQAVKVVPERIYYGFLQLALLALSIDLIARGFER
jgi:uncharacterized membrane protein YfcA